MFSFLQQVKADAGDPRAVQAGRDERNNDAVTEQDAFLAEIARCPTFKEAILRDSFTDLICRLYKLDNVHLFASFRRNAMHPEWEGVHNSMKIDKNLTADNDTQQNFELYLNHFINGYFRNNFASQFPHFRLLLSKDIVQKQWIPFFKEYLKMFSP